MNNEIGGKLWPLAQNPENWKGRNYYMKKSLILFLAFLVVGALAFAAEPTAEVKILEFTGNASATLGFDIDRGMAAFANAVTIDLKLQLLAGGDKTTTGDGIWGELKIETNDSDNSIRIGNADVTTNDTAMQGLSVPDLKVVTAKLNIGKIAYVGIKADGTQLNYTKLMDEAGGFYPVDTTKFYGQLASTDDNTGTLVQNLDISVASDVNAANGIVLGITPEGIGNFTVDLRSVPAWRQDDDQFYVNEWGIRGQADITAVPNLTLKLGAAYSVGERNEIATDVTDPRDFGVGGLVSYKIPIDATMYVMPLVAVDSQLFMFDPDADPNTVIGVEAQVGVRLGWGDKSKLNLYFSPDNDTDWGYYPGITAGVRFMDVDFTDALPAAISPDAVVGLNVSAFSGALVPNLAANVAIEVLDLMAEDLVMGACANLKYDIAMDPMTITPKFGVYYYANAALEDEFASDIYVKAGLDIAKIFPNCTLSFLYQSNDFNGGVFRTDPNVAPTNLDTFDANKAFTMGMFATTLKISF
jgi:hypothetical protein